MSVVGVDGRTGVSRGRSGPDLKALLKAQGVVYLVRRTDGGFAGFPLAG
ncbi:hypothetical protein O1L55_21340 [Streptomyces albulus]|nr:hypothetical protein [Streptomyces noursei]